MANLDKRRFKVMDLFRVLVNKRPSVLFVIDHNSEEVHNLQSPDEKILVLLFALVKRFGVSVSRIFLYVFTKKFK